jgi:hypothetical protein
MASSAILVALAATAELSGRQLSESAVKVFADDLSRFNERDVLTAISRCRIELRAFPTIADIIARIPDGHPGVEEAWALVPKSESDSVVWTDEMSQAFHAARSLLASDPVAARMTFKEVYTKRLLEARAVGSKPRWRTSFGSDRPHRESVIRDAVEKKLLPESYLEDLPALPHQKPKLMLVDNSEEPSTLDVSETMKSIIARLHSSQPDPDGVA